MSPKHPTQFLSDEEIYVIIIMSLYFASPRALETHGPGKLAIRFAKVFTQNLFNAVFETNTLSRQATGLSETATKNTKLF